MNTNVKTTIKIPSLIPTALPKPIIKPIPNIIQKPAPVIPVDNLKVPIIVPPNPLGVLGIDKPTEDDKFNVWCSSLPIPTVKLADENVWIKQYQTYLYRLLETIIPNEEVRKVFVTDENMGTWIQALTHETFNLNKNYEVYETIGDALTASAFIKYLYSWNPNVTPAEITSYNSNYFGKGKDFQSQLSFKLKFTDWVLKVGDIDLYNISEDIFESFIGVLDRISYNVQDTLKSQGKFDLALEAYAGEVVYRFIVMIFTGIPIDEEYGQGSAFTTLGEYGAALGSKEKFFYINIGSADKNYYTEITLNNTGRYLLGREFPKFQKLPNNYLLASAIGASDQQAKNKAAEEAIKVLKDFGASPAWMRTMRENSKLESIDGYEEALAKAKSQGYRKLYVAFPKSTEANGKVSAILSGLSDNGNQTLAQLDKTDLTKRSKTKRQLIQMYLSQ
jgi:dsRNA-specific ribonuclease